MSESLACVPGCNGMAPLGHTAACWKFRAEYHQIDAEEARTAKNRSLAQLATERARAETYKQQAVVNGQRRDMEREMRETAEQQLAAERARAERAEADLAAERERNQPLRDRIKALQDQHDQEIAPLRKKLAYYQGVWKRAVEHLKYVEDGKWTVLPSAFERAIWGELTSRLEAAEGREARLREGLERVEIHLLSRVMDGTRMCDLCKRVAHVSLAVTHKDGCPFAALAGTPEGEP